MKLKHWLLTFFAAVFICAALAAAWNILTDPFGVFGDRLLDWYAYDMTMNPRIAKIAWLDAHHGDYDAYIVGSSKASSLPVADLNRCMDASFYNMTWYGGDLQDENELVHYLVEHYTVRHLVLTVDLQDASAIGYETDPIKGNMHCRVDGSFAPAFYGRYLFANPAYGFEKLLAWGRRGYLMTSDAVYVPETGCYNKQLRDVSPIGAMDEYLALEQNVFYQPPGTPLPCVEQALALVEDIVSLCRERGIELLVVGVPIHDDEFYAYDHAAGRAYWEGLANITDFWEFWGSNAVNSDMRYFYDTNHFRNCVGRMVLARVFGGGGWLPEGFGQRCTRENAAVLAEAAYREAAPTPQNGYTAGVPILIYHVFCEDEAEENELSICRERFASHLAALREAGYTPVLYRDLVSYVYEGSELPARPVVISFDDGYRNNLDIAAPLLREYGACAEISVIGVSVGKDTYRDTGEPIIPHFRLEDAAALVEEGVLGIESHSYDMHQVPERDGEDCRVGVLRQPGEDEYAYAAALEADFLRSKAQIEAALPTRCQVFTYPGGYYDLLSEVVLHGCGATVSVTTEEGSNTIVKGIPQSLYRLKRINVLGGTDAAELLEKL